MGSRDRRRTEDVDFEFNRRVPRPQATGTLLVADGRGGYEAVEVMRFTDANEVLFDDDEYVVFS